MNRWLAVVCALLLAIGTPASAHRLDEYLQATTLSVEQDHVQAQMHLTPGVAVFPTVFASMDTNDDGVLSAVEQQAYAERVLGDLSLTLDGKRLPLRLVSWKFATIREMIEGRGDIQLEFEAEVSPRGGNRRLIFENHHQSRIAAYLVNCLVPRDPEIQVIAQRRNYPQSYYELDYGQTIARSAAPHSAGGSSAWRGLGLTVLLLFAPLAWLWRRAHTGKDTFNGTQYIRL